MRQKSPPIKVRQNSSASKFSASKIIKKINASKFCASEITPNVSASYATLRQNSMSQNSRVIVPCVKRSVRHRPFSRNTVCTYLIAHYLQVFHKQGTSIRNYTVGTRNMLMLQRGKKMLCKICVKAQSTHSSNSNTQVTSD